MGEKKLTEEEQEILDAFEKEGLRPAPDAGAELEAATEAASNTFNKTRRVNLRVTECDFSLAHSRAREEGIPYQTLLSSIVHKYLSGRLAEKR
ncbi:MAG: antitoxin [Gemmatimonadetes bacterium]|jgi:predicted DNA binding CopG/RHH family protein|nr:antitoxin [Gemmatimonadota bacterium]